MRNFNIVLVAAALASAISFTSAASAADAYVGGPALQGALDSNRPNAKFKEPKAKREVVRNYVGGPALDGALESRRTNGKVKHTTDKPTRVGRDQGPVGEEG